MHTHTITHSQPNTLTPAAPIWQNLGQVVPPAPASVLALFPASQRAALACRTTSHPRTLLLAAGSRLERVVLGAGTAKRWCLQQLADGGFFTALAGPDWTGPGDDPGSEAAEPPPRQHLAAAVTSAGQVLLLDLRRPTATVAEWVGHHPSGQPTQLRFVPPLSARRAVALAGAAPFGNVDFVYECRFSLSALGKRELSAGPGELRARVEGRARAPVPGRKLDDASAAERGPWLRWRPLAGQEYRPRPVPFRLRHGDAALLSEGLRRTAGWHVHGPPPGWQHHATKKVGPGTYPLAVHDPKFMGWAYLGRRVQARHGGRAAGRCAGVSVRLLPSGDLSFSRLAWGTHAAGDPPLPLLLWPDQPPTIDDRGAASEWTTPRELAMPPRQLLRRLPGTFCDDCRGRVPEFQGLASTGSGGVLHDGFLPPRS